VKDRVALRSDQLHDVDLAVVLVAVRDEHLGDLVGVVADKVWAQPPPHDVGLQRGAHSVAVVAPQRVEEADRNSMFLRFTFTSFQVEASFS
jgi:hypothetical protein